MNESLSDTYEIQKLAFLFGMALDSRSVEGYELFDQCMTPDVEVSYEFGCWKGLAAQKENTRKMLTDVFTFTHHIVSNPVITITGDEADAKYKVTGAHGVRDGEGQRVIWGGAVYQQYCVRTSSGWRIKRHCCGKSWVDDSTGLMARLMAGSASRPKDDQKSIKLSGENK
jgi:hypothetical protein